MFAQERPQYLDKFFEKRGFPQLSWIHDINRARYGAASRTLLSEADHASELSAKHVRALSPRYLIAWLIPSS